jgi:acyl-CoA reductase-like NAD-dependent aldehyde dehydrogenase
MKYMKPVLMELGDKNAAIVLKDANVQRTAMLCVQGSVMHYGQVCMSTDTIIVEWAVADSFIEKLKEAAGSLNGNADFAVSKAMAQKAQTTIAESLTALATLVAGANGMNGKIGAALEPTFMIHVKSDNPLNDIETFGSSASIHVAVNEHEATEVANNTFYGLTGAVHTTDIMKGIRVVKQMDAGVIEINGVTLWEESSVPMGGMKGSGWGKNNSRFGMEEFLVEKVIAGLDPSAAPDFGSA